MKDKLYEIMIISDSRRILMKFQFLLSVIIKILNKICNLVELIKKIRNYLLKFNKNCYLLFEKFISWKESKNSKYKMLSFEQRK
jgi:hypothetical protein